ncbi:alkaline phosphatase family protein, partial [Chlamydiota bacterium]
MFRKKKKNKVIVIGLDGVPYSFLKKHSPNTLSSFSFLHTKGSFRQMNSVYPTVSSVAWTSFLTGKNPAKHRIFGFADRTPNPFQLFIPLADHKGCPDILDILSDHNKKVICINVPVTFPPKKVNGYLVSGFMCPAISKGTFPSSLETRLTSMDYIIDVDAKKGHTDKNSFMDDLHRALDKRIEIFYHFLKEDADYYHMHFMETDRINHFFWHEKDDPINPYHTSFFAFYKKIGNFLSDLLNNYKEHTIVILSDHGFATCKKEVNLDVWMKDNEFLRYKTLTPKGLNDIDLSQTHAYNLIPGRIFINLCNR